MTLCLAIRAGGKRTVGRWAHAYFQLQLEHGKTPNKAKRALAFKWQRILFRCWQSGTPYNEDVYIAALRQRGSPLFERIDALASAA